MTLSRPPVSHPRPLGAEYLGDHLFLTFSGQSSTTASHPSPALPLPEGARSSARDPHRQVRSAAGGG